MHVKKGSKYIKVMKDYGNGQRSVWGFIVASENDKKFQVGDILMLERSARNKARGNVISGDFGSSWTYFLIIFREDFLLDFSLRDIKENKLISPREYSIISD